MADAARRAHLNLVESSRRLFGLDPGAEVDSGDGRLLGAGSASHPVVSNAAFRTDDDLDPERLLSEAARFFGRRGRGFALWARGGAEEDRELIAAAEADGFRCVYEMPEMLLAGRAEERDLPDGAELRLLTTAEEATEYWRIATAAYQSIGYPPEAFVAYEGLERLGGDDAAVFLAYLDGSPVSIAMTIVSHGVAGIYWVGSLSEARGRGLGRAVTAAAANAGLDLGADVASLQASPMGEPIYRAMGFEAVHDYRLLLSPAP